MRIASVAEMKAQLSAYVKASEQGPVVVTRNGKPVAVLLGVEHEDELERLVLAYSKRFRSVLEAARQQIREGGGIPHDQFWQEVEAEAEA
jgi:prevent-host-death family protein